MKLVNSKKDIFTIPNALSLFRFILAGVFLWMYYASEIENKRYWLTGVLLLSAVTDFLDGKIARRWNMVSEIGKILDPIADKLTQCVLIVCLLSEYPLLRAVFALFLVKEILVAAAGYKVLEKTEHNDGAMWYGKVNTAVFYAVMVILIFIPWIPYSLANVLIAVSGCFMLLAFVMYIWKFSRILRGKSGKDSGTVR